MPNEMSATLAARLDADESLRRAIAEAASPDDVVRVLVDAGFSVSVDDVAPRQPEAELSDAELGGVSGAGFTTYGCNTPTQYFVFTHCYP